MGDVKVLEGAEEFSLGNGPTAALLIHGFTSSPQNMRPLGDYLAQRGLAVVAPRLPGHGTSWEDLERAVAAEWVGTVDDAFHRLAAEHSPVFIVALSFGSALAIDIAARHPERVSGVVTLAPYVHPKDVRAYLSPFIKRLRRTIPGVGNDIADPELREIVYDEIPTAATHEMLGVARRARVALPAVRCPLLVIHSRNDHTAHPHNAQLVYDKAGSSDKELLWLERSYHVITLDVDRDEVYRRTFEFIARRSDLEAADAV